MMRIGSGFDVHAFSSGDSVVLGGVRIAHSHGLLAHSDGDVLDPCPVRCLARRAGLGRHRLAFSAWRMRWKDADSTGLLAQCMLLIRGKGYEIGNVDATVICEAPKINPHVSAMRARLAEVMQVDADRLSIKATTTEKLGFTGRGEGIAAQAVVLLEKK